MQIVVLYPHFFFVVWASCYRPLPGGTRSRGRCWAAIRFSSSRTVRPCSPWGGRWIGHRRTTFSTICSSASHSQAAEEAIPHVCKQECKHPTPVRRRLSRTYAVLGRVMPGGMRQESFLLAWPFQEQRGFSAFNTVVNFRM